MTLTKITKHHIKGLVKHALARFRLEIRSVRTVDGPGSAARPVASSPLLLLEDLAARGFNPEAILDVGANRGDWTRIALSVFPNARYLLLEPQVEMKGQLNSLCRQHPNVEWLQLAAGRISERLALTVWDNLNGSSFLPDVQEDLLETGRQRMVEVSPIDSVLAQASFPVPDLVKLDIQGYELEAIKGASGIIGKTEMFILETSLYRFFRDTPILSEVVSFMADKGYVVYDIAGYSRRPLDGALAQVDLAFAREAGVLRKSSSWG